MATDSSASTVNWYRNRIGEPATEDEVLGYWVFALGVVFGALGLLLSIGAGPASTLRELAVVLGATGLLLILAGPIIRLPLQRLATQLTYVGVAIGVGAILWFIVAFPANWSPQTGNAAIVALYGFGVVIIGVSGIAVPILGSGAGRHGTETVPSATALESVRASLADAEADEADLARELLALHESNARFELYQDAADEWRWRLRHRNGNIIATSGEGYTQRHNAQNGMQSVRRNGLGATVLEFESEAALPAVEESFDPVEDVPSRADFEVYEDSAGEWRWRLVHENGNILADSGEGYASKGGVDRAVERVRQLVDPADHLVFDGPVFETYSDRGGEWRWRLVHQNGNILADSGEGFVSHGNARRAVRRLRESVDDLGFEVYEDRRGEHRWRARAANNELVADSGEGYARKSGAADAVENVEAAIADADVLAVGLAAFEIFEDASGAWRWRLRHRNGNILADCGEGYSDRSSVVDAIRSVKRNAPGAGPEA